jgi:hypothetical protein
MGDPVKVVTSNTPPAHVELKSDHVSLVGLDLKLLTFLTAAGLVHHALFDLPLVVTCAVDMVEHKTGKHPVGKAVDLRINDLELFEVDRFLLAVVTLCDRIGLAVFDERNLPGAPHFHVEVP